MGMMGFPIDAEYNTLRAEILNESALQTNLRVAMCTIAIVVITFACERENPILFLITYVVILPFQLLCKSKQMGILRISAYLIVRYERRFTHLKWETYAIEVNANSKKPLINFHLAITKLGYFIPVVMGLIAFIGNCIYVLNSEISAFMLIADITFSVLCLIIIMFLELSMNGKKIRQAYIDEFEKIV